MKTHRRHATVEEVIDPSPFDYTLLSHLYVHSDGTDVIDFSGLAPGKESRCRVNSFLKNRSFAPGMTEAEPEAVGSYLHLRIEENDRSTVDDSECCKIPGAHTSAPPRGGSAPASNLVRIEDSAEHWWFMCQAAEDTAPYARLFHGAGDLLSYLEQHNLQLPTGRSWMSDPSTDAGLPHGGQPQPHQHSSNSVTGGTTSILPLTKWLDIQIDRSNPRSAERVAQLLNRLPISQETKDSCLYLSTVDSIDISLLATSDVSSTMSDYVFLNLMCTPVVENDVNCAGATTATTASDEKRFLHGLGGGNFGFSSTDKKKRTAKSGKTQKRSAAHVSSQGTLSATRSVMEMRFEAVRMGAPRSSVPEPVAVAVIVFADWMFTIHEKPFAEMDDMLRMVQLHCAPSEVTTSHLRYAAALSPTMQRRFTAPFAMSVLLQIVVGHHLDSITLAKAVDALGDCVFDVRERKRDQDAVLKHITAVRRCFGECGTETARREVLFASLLQPMFADRFFVADPTIRRELENAQAHLRHFQRDIADCRDTVALSNWHNNVAIQWVLLRRGNRALRMVLLLAQMTNIMQPIVIVQTLYAMNVPLPFEADGDPPHTTLAPFFVLAAIFLIYCGLTVGSIRHVLVRKSFETRLLA
ncbi:protein of unknown function - conserved [Leishmania donovani]|uniref:Uncharacterized protein n=3 Tax=Leishmania donovani species complex TaxID=38574 RepID=A4ICL7_LEIIN|nr:conserved hypothetical protein [Leishmania infantum JPCM5]TPP42319.1 hypothetical protein CGC20_29305 [Leishmania donovani]CAC9549380.1 hypothetical_protein_-_conserved [Leishmania infantum]CAJ1993483.1 protein of unknown function - conserved [Leishmania donovani]CAM72595.1 conserved hypothetical protein [Leishmania infantum JPCM5]SUZ46495.1 hypothetical_protein_-_conserved [Leishmania infantum]|eukprot:XP_001469486.1 conserved hypothetical protein [Leishmania infantum JPCM5]